MADESAETRVLILKPGDVLCISNAGSLLDRPADQWQPLLGMLQDLLGLKKVIVFEGDVELSKVGP